MKVEALTLFRFPLTVYPRMYVIDSIDLYYTLAGDEAILDSVLDYENESGLLSLSEIHATDRPETPPTNGKKKKKRKKKV